MYMSHRESSSSHYESYKPGFYQGEGQIFLVTILPLAQSRSSKINNIAAADRASGLQFPQAMRRSGGKLPFRTKSRASERQSMARSRGSGDLILLRRLSGGDCLERRYGLNQRP